MMNYAVETQDLSKKFAGVKALNGVSLQIPRGTVFALLGPNGSGKTTLLKLLLGLLHPSSGNANCLGMDIAKNSQGIRERAGYIGEEPRLYDYMEVEEFIVFCQGIYPSWNRQTMQNYLKEFHIPPKEKIKNLSHGMRSQLSLLVTLAPEPDILFLDEPTSGLDPIFKRRFLDTVLAETIGRGKTVIIASHHLNDIEKVADHVTFLYEGQVLQTSPLQELKDSIKDIRIVFQSEPPPALLDMEGITAVHRKDNAFHIQVSSNLNKIWRYCSLVPYFTMEMIDLELEDIFFRLLNHKVKGEKRDGK